MRHTALQTYLKEWNPSNTVSINVEKITFDQLQMVRVSTPATKDHLESCLGDSLAEAQITMLENVALAFAIAWRVHIGDTEFTPDALANPDDPA